VNRVSASLPDCSPRTNVEGTARIYSETTGFAGRGSADMLNMLV
jgi:hypothetical protein